MIKIIKNLSLSFLVIAAMLIISYCSKEENPIIQNDSALVLIYPVGGESFPTDTTIKIKWSSTKVDSISIHLSTNNGNSWSEIINSVSANLFEWEWDEPSLISDSCKIKIVSKSDVSINDESNSSFSIYVNAIIDLLTPNGGEVWESLTDYSIEWTSENLDSIFIEFTSDNGDTWQIIDTVVASYGNFLWNTHYQPSEDYKVSISPTNYPYLKEESESNFTITIAPWITESLKHYPLNVGNKWIYDTVLFPSGGGSDTTFTVLEVIDVQIQRENKIFKLKQFTNNHLPYHFYDEVDSLTGIVTRSWQSSQSEIWLDLIASAGDTIFSGGPYGLYLLLLSENFETIFGYQTHFKFYKRSDVYSNSFYKYSKSFGMTYYQASTEFGMTLRTLKGCIIDGVVYGDTTTVTGY